MLRKIFFLLSFFIFLRLYPNCIYLIYQHISQDCIGIYEVMREVHVIHIRAFE